MLRGLKGGLEESRYSVESRGPQRLQSESRQVRSIGRPEEDEDDEPSCGCCLLVPMMMYVFSQEAIAIGVEGRRSKVLFRGAALRWVSRRSCLRLSIRTGSTIIVGVGRSLLIMLMMSVEYSREWSTQRPSSIGLHAPTFNPCTDAADAAPAEPMPNAERMQQQQSASTLA